MLKGTNGTLAVSRVFLNGLEYRGLKLLFKDGRIAEYTCKNFETEEENKSFLKENLLHHHETLPLGEFAIGTNTTAYVMAQKYNIADTCYSWSEDTAVYNPDGKEIIARDNEVSILRKEDISKAYLGCHTDITIPYDELDKIWVEIENGENIEIIRDGKFVLEGTEKLNEPFCG